MVFRFFVRMAEVTPQRDGPQQLPEPEPRTEGPEHEKLDIFLLTFLDLHLGQAGSSEAFNLR